MFNQTNYVYVEDKEGDQWLIRVLHPLTLTQVTAIRVKSYMRSCLERDGTVLFGLGNKTLVKHQMGGEWN